MDYIISPNWNSWLIAFLVINLIHFLGTWKLYILAGRKAWEAAIPLYNVWVLLDIIKRSKKWMLILFIPIVAPLMFAILWVETARSFGKRDLIHALLCIFTLGFYLYYLNYIEKPAYTGPEERVENLIASLLYAIILATIVHTFVIQPYTIPTSSMEKTLLVGDFLFVSKLNYGSRVPVTPVGIPFTQSSFFGKRSYVDKIRLPYFRFPSFEKVKKNDIVVFNYPMDPENLALDRKTPYVKRCVGLPGETVEIKDGIVFTDGKEEVLPGDAQRQFNYEVYTGGQPLNVEMLLEELKYLSADDVKYGALGDQPVYLFEGLTEEQATVLSKYPSVQKIIKSRPDPKLATGVAYNEDGSINEENSVMPLDKGYTSFNLGPLQIPKKGDVIIPSKENYYLYKDLLERSEGKTVVKTANGYTIDGKSGPYTLSQDYYYMMGDNRDMSLDGRFFGFVGENHILGKPVFIWMSWFNMFSDGKANAPSKWKANWERFFTVPNNGEPNKTSYLWIGVLFLVWFFGWDFFKKK
ncbi:MAG: signal peptidase I [Flavobacteriaceae bacterium]|nr:MAG: signal peptidase I [Flavobacteriaceae bacterium]